MVLLHEPRDYLAIDSGQCHCRKVVVSRSAITVPSLRGLFSRGGASNHAEFIPANSGLFSLIQAKSA